MLIYPSFFCANALFTETLTILLSFFLLGRVRENESLFTYNISGSTYQFYNNHSIIPKKFISDLSEVNKTAYVNESCTNKNVNLSMCEGNLACLVDAVAMCNLTFGKRSRTTEIDAKDEKKILGMFRTLGNIIILPEKCRLSIELPLRLSVILSYRHTCLGCN